MATYEIVDIHGNVETVEESGSSEWSDKFMDAVLTPLWDEANDTEIPVGTSVVIRRVA